MGRQPGGWLSYFSVISEGDTEKVLQSAIIPNKTEQAAEYGIKIV